MSESPTRPAPTEQSPTPESVTATGQTRPDDPRPRIARWVFWGALAVLLVTPPFYLDNSWLLVLLYIMIGAVGAMGLTLLTGQAGQLSLATPFFMFAGGVAYCVISGPDEPGTIGWDLPTSIGVVGAVLFCAGLGLVFAPVAGRVRGVYLGVATLALVYIGFYAGREYSSFTGGTASGRRAPDLEVFGFSFVRADPELTILGVDFDDRGQRLWFPFLLFTLLAYVLARGAVRSRPGRAWRAVRDNESAAAALGVPVPRVRAEAFAVSSAYAGLAGVMTVLWLRLLKPDEDVFVGTFSITVAIAFLAMVLIGGLGSIGGAVVGAALVYGLPQALPKWIGSDEVFGSGDTAVTPLIFTSFVYGAAVIAVVLFEPGGLAALGRRVLDAARRGPLGPFLAPSKGS